MKVYITRQLPDIAFRLLIQNKIHFEFYKKDYPIPRSLLLKKVIKCAALISLLTDRIDKEIIDSMTSCKIIANYAVGYDNIDINYARKKKIIVTNTPDVLTDSTADLTLALALACARRIREGMEILVKSKYKSWKPKFLLGTELKGKTFGIVGAGRIGTAVGIRAKAFGVKIIYTDNKRNLYLEKFTEAKKATLSALLKKSDFISIHLPLNKYTYHYMNQRRLEYMNPDAILINTSRGEIIDEQSLINILKEGKIKAVGLDVFENEPNINKALLRFKNVLVLPHLGSATTEARNAMAELAVRNVINVLKGKNPLTPVF